MSTDLVTVNYYYNKLEAETRSYKDFIELMEPLSSDQIRASNENLKKISQSIISANYATQKVINSDGYVLYYGNDIFISNNHVATGAMDSNMSLGIARHKDVFNNIETHKIRSTEGFHPREYPALTKSIELYNRALKNYDITYFEEAVEDLLKAIAENKTDYVAWFLLGKTYLFGVSKFVNIIDLDKAIEYFITAAKYINYYAENDSYYNETFRAAAKSHAAEIWYYLALAQNNKAMELLHNQNTIAYNDFIKKALNSFEQSYTYSNKMLESLYYVAKCKVNLNDEKGAIETLTTCVIKDKRYFLKAFTDSDFNRINGFMDRLSDSVKSKIYPELKKKFDEIQYFKLSIAFPELFVEVPILSTQDITIIDMLVLDGINLKEKIYRAEVSINGYKYVLLDISDNKALFISKHIIEDRRYHNTSTTITWADCDLRKYLNGEFYNKLPKTLKSRIIEVNNINENNQCYGTAGGCNTTDKIFLLSISELVNYFGDSEQLKNMNSSSRWSMRDLYISKRTAISLGLIYSGWLRSPGADSRSACLVYSSDESFVDGRSVDYPRIGIRPAFWVNL